VAGLELTVGLVAAVVVVLLGGAVAATELDGALVAAVSLVHAARTSVAARASRTETVGRLIRER